VTDFTADMSANKTVLSRAQFKVRFIKKIVPKIRIGTIPLPFGILM
jgi:hypothetical protein